MRAIFTANKISSITIESLEQDGKKNTINKLE